MQWACLLFSYLLPSKTAAPRSRFPLLSSANLAVDFSTRNTMQNNYGLFASQLRPKWNANTASLHSNYGLNGM